ncbi:MAG: response regulator [Candidatus Methylomirabilis sp.]|nr:response regulator [Deltaproteobacteria bacterium]
MSKRILVVEDNDLNMELVRDLLGFGGYEVLEAGDARSAIALAERETPDLILMDVQLPGMDGLTATKILKETEATAAIPVVALTAHAMKGDAEKAFAAGCSGYITKPINTRSFAAEIGDFLKAA